MSYLKVAAPYTSTVPFKQVFICLKAKVVVLNKKAVYKLVCYLWCILGSELPSDVSITDELEMKNFYNVNVCLIV